MKSLASINAARDKSTNSKANSFGQHRQIDRVAEHNCLDLKELTILNDFKSINSQIVNQCATFKSKEAHVENQLSVAKDNL